MINDDWNKPWPYLLATLLWNFTTNPSVSFKTCMDYTFRCPKSSPPKNLAPKSSYVSKKNTCLPTNVQKKALELKKPYINKSMKPLDLLLMIQKSGDDQLRLVVEIPVFTGWTTHPSVGCLAFFPSTTWPNKWCLLDFQISIVAILTFLFLSILKWSKILEHSRA